MSDATRDERLAEAIAAYRETGIDDVAILRRYAGTASGAYVHSSRAWARLWNWAVDAEYTSVGPAPIVWMGAIVAIAAWVLAVVVLV